MAKALKPFLEKKTLPGYVALFGTPEKITFFEAGGVADLATDEPMKKNSMFWIASMSKPIAGAALMMLVDEGKISLDDPISKFFPEIKNSMIISEKKNSDGTILLEKIKTIPTVRQVMSHTAGFPFITPFMNRFGIDAVSLQCSTFLAITSPLQYQPGTKYQYSNVGINTGAAIVEIVSKMPYETFLQKRLFDPLGMKDTTFFPSTDQLKRMAKSYTWDKSKKTLKEISVHYLGDLNDPKAVRYTEAGGGLFSTAEDYYNFYKMLASNGTFNGKRILSEKAVAEMTKDQTGLNKNYGIAIAVSNDSFSHGGAYATQCFYNKNLKKIAVFMIQLSSVSELKNINKAAINAAAKMNK